MSEMRDLIVQGPRSKFVTLVRDEQRNTQSYTWRVWAQGTSFYVKPRHRPVSGFKVSLHGPRDCGTETFWKVAIDWRDRDNAFAAGGAALHLGDDYREEFVGQKIRRGVRLAVRIRNAWTSFARGMPSGPNPGDVRTRDLDTSFHGALPAPAQMCFADIDLYVSDTGRPYWPYEKKLVRDNAKIGWLVNEAGQHLTGVSVQRRIDVPTPPGLDPSMPAGPGDRLLRAVGSGVVDDLLWIVESTVPRESFSAALKAAGKPLPDVADEFGSDQP